MAGFLPQHYFDLAVVSVVRFSVMAKMPPGAAAMVLCQKFLQKHQLDVTLKEELTLASEGFLTAAKERHPKLDILDSLRQLEFCITRYQPDGEKKKRGFFFAKREPLYADVQDPDRYAKASQGLLHYLEGIAAGRFERAPEGWSL